MITTHNYLCVLFLQSLAEIKHGNNWGNFDRLNLYCFTLFYFVVDLRTAKVCVLRVILPLHTDSISRRNRYVEIHVFAGHRSSLRITIQFVITTTCVMLCL